MGAKVEGSQEPVRRLVIIHAVRVGSRCREEVGFEVYFGSRIC